MHGVIPLMNRLLLDVSSGASVNDVCMVGMSGCGSAAFRVEGLSIQMPTKKEMDDIHHVGGH